MAAQVVKPAYVRFGPLQVALAPDVNAMDCVTCGESVYVADVEGKPCEACVNNKRIYFCKGCCLPYLWPQYSPDSGPHYCRPEHRRDDGTFPVTLRMTWQSQLSAELAYTRHMELPIWSCTPLEVAHAFLSTTRLHDFMHISNTTFSKWNDAVALRIGPQAPTLVAGKSFLVQQYVERTPGVLVLDVMRYLCDEAMLYRRDHHAAYMMENIPLADTRPTFTIGKLLDPETRLTELMKPEDFILFTLAEDNERALCFDQAAHHIWASTTAMRNYDPRKTVIHIIHDQIADFTYDEPPPAPAPPKPPKSSYSQKAPMSQIKKPKPKPKPEKRERTEPAKPRKAYTEVNDWCREQGAGRQKRGGTADNPCYKPSTRDHACIKVVDNFNFIVQVRGGSTARARLFAEYPHVPKMYYNAHRAERTLMLVTCSSEAERTERIANHTRAMRADHVMKRVNGAHLKQLLREWFHGDAHRDVGRDDVDEDDDDEEEADAQQEDEEEEEEEECDKEYEQEVEVKKAKVTEPDLPPPMEMPQLSVIVEEPTTTTTTAPMDEEESLDYDLLF